ncbi:unnamed protein product, partial [Prorocentrum cordatum]
MTSAGPGLRSSVKRKSCSAQPAGKDNIPSMNHRVMSCRALWLWPLVWEPALAHTAPAGALGAPSLVYTKQRPSQRRITASKRGLPATSHPSVGQRGPARRSPAQRGPAQRKAEPWQLSATVDPRGRLGTPPAPDLPSAAPPQPRPPPAFSASGPLSAAPVRRPRAAAPGPADCCPCRGGRSGYRRRAPFPPPGLAVAVAVAVGGPAGGLR